MSISRKLFLGISTFIMAFVLIAYGCFATLMPGYVEALKLDEMKSIASQVKTAGSEENINTLIRDLTASSDISVVIDTRGRGMYGSGTSHGHGMGRNMGDGLGSMLRTSDMEVQDGLFISQHHVLNTPFMVYKESGADMTVYVMRPAQSVDDVVEASKGFFVIIAALAIGAGLLFSFAYSKRFVNPILELNRIAGHMSKLDFTHTYNGSTKDEIGDLGRSINHLSNQLEQALSDLEAELRHSEKLNDEQKRFLADASHELKTPLAVIMGNIEQLTEVGGLDKVASKYSKAIIRETEHMDQIIKDLLKLSQLESDTISLNIEETDLASIFDDVLFSFSAMIKARKLSLDYKLSDAIPVKADHKQMETVVRNVVSNAIIHSPEGAAIRISSVEREDSQLVEVFNQGDQIPESHIDKVFDRFSKVSISGADVEDGVETKKTTGLGLSIVKRILELHDFDYGLENRENGIVFFLKVEK